MTDDARGVSEGYEDTRGVWREVPASSREAIHAAMGPPSVPGSPPVRILEPGASRVLSQPGRLRLEDGTTLAVERSLPPDLPPGYHDLHRLGGGAPIRLIV